MEVSCLPPFLSSAIGSLTQFLDARVRDLFARVIVGMLLATEPRRTASKWFRAAAIGKAYRSAYEQLQRVGEKSSVLARCMLSTIERHPAGSASDKIVIAIDDTLTKRAGPRVQGAGYHHNPTPGPSGSETAYGHNFVVAARLCKHPEHGTIALPFDSEMYVREVDLEKLPEKNERPFRTKLDMAVGILERAERTLRSSNRPIWVAADGGYAKKPILEACRRLNLGLVSRLRKDAALREVPKAPKTPSRGRPRKYGERAISLAKRAAARGGWTEEAMELYGREQVKTYKSFVATWKPAGGPIRVVLVKEDDGWVAFFSNRVDATPREILELVAGRNALEQAFKEVKEVWGAGKQQLRDADANAGAFCLNLWMLSLTELWAWELPKERLVDRSDRPWDRADRRPSHDDRRKALRYEVLRAELNAVPLAGDDAPKIQGVLQCLLKMVARG